MIYQPDMLMLGSAGRNSGKTEFACRIIKKFKPRTDIVGIKVTTVREKDGLCPRGGEGCGVCTSLEGNYSIYEEDNTLSGKDTSRMLVAGAKKVFWLRVLKDHLAEGFSALTDIIGRNAVTVCESNSLRNLVEPGLFLVIREKGASKIKKTSREVIDLADGIIISDEPDFDFDFERLKLIDREWLIKRQASAIILAGGKSRRMGQDKSMLIVNGKPLIEHIFYQLRSCFDQVIISADDKSKFSFLDAEIIPDETPGQGPLMGILSSLEASKSDINFVVACDIPTINNSFLKKMMRGIKGYDCVIPVRDSKKYEPLFGIYRRSMITPMRRAIEEGKRKITEAFDKAEINYIEFEDAEWYRNLNTKKDFDLFDKSD